jgi:neutral ceramidase
MKDISKYRLLMMLIIFVPGINFGQKNEKEGPFIKLGISEINITPQKAIRMGGYGARKGPSTGVHDDLFASALFFSGEVNKALLITVDVIGLNAQFIDETKKMISSKIGVPAENIMISALHNHGGPATQLIEGELSGAVNEYIKFLKERLTLLAIEASKKEVPFRMGIGKGFSDMNINRRARFSDGSIGLGRNPDGPADHELAVVKFEDMNNNALAFLVNWPCHATVNGSENNLITGDWPGAVARYLKKEAGKEIVVAITAGASANINPIYGPGTSFKEIEAVGFNVGTEAWKTIAKISTFPVKSIQEKNLTLKFPGKMRTNNYLPQTSYANGPEVELRLTAMKIGNLVLCGISGELFTEIGMEVKKQSPYANTLIVTHCNGSNGYICTDKSFSDGGYETGASWLMPGIEKPLTEKFIELICSF